MNKEKFKLKYAILVYGLISSGKALALPDGFYLINAATGSGTKITSGTVIRKQDFPASYSLSREVSASGVKAMKLTCNNALIASKSEYGAPYSLFGDSAGVYKGSVPSSQLIGACSFVAGTESISFTVTDDSSAPVSSATNVGFYLVDAKTDTLGSKIINNSILRLPENFSIEYKDPLAKSGVTIQLKLKDSIAPLFTKIERGSPYALFGNSGSDYFGNGVFQLQSGSTYDVSAGGNSVRFTVAGAPTPTSDFVATDHIYTKNEGPDVNPMKGWSSGRSNSYPESSVRFLYIAWSRFEPADQKFSFSYIEDELIAKGGSNGQHLILRLFCDWNSAECPQWMYNQGVPKIFNGVDSITDFNSPVFIKQAQEAIKALAERYDNDPRIFVFQFGILGNWGEWNTAGTSANLPGDGKISLISKSAIVQAYLDNFKNVMFQARYPWSDVWLNSISRVGYQNDYFYAGNNHNNQFQFYLKGRNLHANGPIGGETPPRAQNSAELYHTITAADVSNADYVKRYRIDTKDIGKTFGEVMVSQSHYSSMLTGAYRKRPGDLEYDKYMKIHRSMGYNFQIEKASFPNSSATNQIFQVKLNVTNIGIAPFYYPWQVQFALLDANDKSVIYKINADQIFRVNPPEIDTVFNLKSLREKTTAVLRASIPANRLLAGKYILAARIIQPKADTPDAVNWKLNPRNACIQFANNLPVENVRWENGSGLAGCWSQLGGVNIQ